jgi:hypothetical protein
MVRHDIEMASVSIIQSQCVVTVMYFFSLIRDLLHNRFVFHPCRPAVNLPETKALEQTVT